jgi:hypothetical protein
MLQLRMLMIVAGIASYQGRLWEIVLLFAIGWITTEDWSKPTMNPRIYWYLHCCDMVASSFATNIAGTAASERHHVYPNRRYERKGSLERRAHCVPANIPEDTIPEILARAAISATDNVILVRQFTRRCRLGLRANMTEERKREKRAERIKRV